MSEPRLVLSASSISAYLRCHKAYEFSNVFRLSTGQSLPAALGTALHAAVETLWKSPKRPQSTLERTFAAELAHVPLPYDEPPEGVLRDATRMLVVYMQRIAPTFAPTLVEERFIIEVEGVLLAGTIDAADADDLRDLKTTSMISKFDPASHGLQLNLYRLGYKFITGDWPKRLLLDVLTRRGNVPYRQYEVPVETGDLLDAVTIVSSGIAKEDYSPTGAINGACRWCAYQRVCVYAKVD